VALQTLVGGDFEVLPSPDGIRATVLASQDAKRQGRPANHPATRLIRSRIKPDDFVAGVVVVTGPIADDGSLTDLDGATELAVANRMAP
jgi:hypothetical protein